MAGIKITGTGRQIERLQSIADAASEPVMKATMQQLRNQITQRTERGKFLNGSGKKYSTKGALYAIGTSKALLREYRSRLIGASSKYQLFGRSGEKHKRRGMPKDESTAKWIFLERGYMQYRQIHGRQTNFVDLNFEGAMLQSMNDITARDGYASLGFYQPDQEQKARWLSEMGAGKNKIKYEFFGLTEEDRQKGLQVFDQEWTAQLRELGII